MEKYWNQLGIKDKIQYAIAIILICSGIVMAFLSFFLHQYDIASGTLIYIAQCFITAGAIFGVSVYFKGKIGEFKTDTIKKIMDELKKDKE